MSYKKAFMKAEKNMISKDDTKSDAQIQMRSMVGMNNKKMNDKATNKMS